MTSRPPSAGKDLPLLPRLDPADEAGALPDLEQRYVHGDGLTPSHHAEGEQRPWWESQ